MKVTTIDDLRERANDLQSLCYITYKKIISPTEFKKLKGDYSTRCDCAHPTDIKLSVNEIVGLFDHCHSLILANEGLR